MAVYTADLLLEEDPQSENRHQITQQDIAIQVARKEKKPMNILLTGSTGLVGSTLIPFLTACGHNVVRLVRTRPTIHHAIITKDLRGPVNATAPRPVTNSEFTKTLGRVLGRPTILPLPAFAARLALGEMADALLLASTAVNPVRLVKSDYQFRHPNLE